ncbi:hypothetical protein LCGC14_2410650 [marine sediment metagenome]|uniref:HTH marR-type domain-containing protein n=1 Tax=marine sediment metagenome TaxID=412755 RepID=A0A0F9BSH6_9ZZZZ
MTSKTMMTKEPFLIEDDMAVLLFLCEIRTDDGPIPIQLLHEDMEERYGWLVLDVKGSIKRLFDQALIAVAGSTRSHLAVTELGKQVAKRISEMR